MRSTRQAAGAAAVNVMNRLIAACLLPAILSGCGLQGVGALLPVIEGGLGGLGGGGSSTTLTLHIDQAHGDLTMGNPPAMTPINPGSPIVLQPAPQPPPSMPPPPTSGGPTPVPLPPISAPNPVPVVP